MGRPHPFTKLLREAYEASEDVDFFDLHKDDPESLRRWHRLREIADAAEERLIDHILRTAGQERIYG